mgnify:CR=1 FL=1
MFKQLFATIVVIALCSNVYAQDAPFTIAESGITLKRNVIVSERSLLKAGTILQAGQHVPPHLALPVSGEIGSDFVLRTDSYFPAGVILREGTVFAKGSALCFDHTALFSSTSGSAPDGTSPLLLIRKDKVDLLVQQVNILANENDKLHKVKIEDDKQIATLTSENRKLLGTLDWYKEKLDAGNAKIWENEKKIFLLRAKLEKAGDADELKLQLGQALLRGEYLRGQNKVLHNELQDWKHRPEVVREVHVYRSHPVYVYPAYYYYPCR